MQVVQPLESVDEGPYTKHKLHSNLQLPTEQQIGHEPDEMHHFFVGEYDLNERFFVGFKTQFALECRKEMRCQEDPEGRNLLLLAKREADKVCQEEDVFHMA